MRTVCLLPKAKLSVSQCYQHDHVVLTKRNPKDRLNIGVTTLGNQNLCFERCRSTHDWGVVVTRSYFIIVTKTKVMNLLICES